MAEAPGTHHTTATKVSLNREFHRADARHEISCRQYCLFIYKHILSGNLLNGMAEAPGTHHTTATRVSLHLINQY